MPWAYHYANRPDLSAAQVRSVVFSHFNTGIGGIPGNDDSGAMAALLVFHLLGMYPVPSSTQLLIGSPMVSNFTIHNNFFGTSTTFTVDGFDPTSIVATPPAGSRFYVSNVAINGVVQVSRCWVDFRDVFAQSASVVITVTGDQSTAMDCGTGANALPDSLSTGGFNT